MRHTAAGSAALFLLLLAACDNSPGESPVASTDVSAVPAEFEAAKVTPVDEIHWRKGDVTAAFSEAAEAGKPILLYWGAEWCPPCHRLRAGLFMEPDFIARTHDFVAVYLDGDTEGAQRWGDHFAIAGYPTIILLRPDQSEITRLSGGEEPDEIAQVLRAAQESQVSAIDLFTRAQQTPDQLTANDWALLAAYGWEVDGTALVPAEERATLFHKLAAAAPDAALQRRFALLALEDEANNEAPGYDAARQAEIRGLLATLLASADEVKRSRWPLMYSTATIIERAGGTPEERKALEAALVTALDRLFTDESLPVVDRVLTLRAELDIHHRNNGEEAAPAPELLEKVRARAAWADVTAQTPPERQSAIYYAAGLLYDAGDLDGAEQLLTAELARSATPYYYMPDLADIAEKRGDKAGALDWLRKGYETSLGPATRVQWGVLYADGVLRLAPDDVAGVEQATMRVIDELAQPDSYHQRTRVRLDALGATLLAWSKDKAEAQAAVARLRAHMHDVCAPAQSDEAARAACLAWMPAEA